MVDGSLTKGYWKPSSQGRGHRAIPFTQHWDQLPCSSVEWHPALCAGRIKWRGSAEEEGPDLSISFQVHHDSLRKMRGNASCWLPLSCPAALPASCSPAHLQGTLLPPDLAAIAKRVKGKEQAKGCWAQQ